MRHFLGGKMTQYIFRRVTRGGRMGGLPCPFPKIKKSALNLEKNALTLVICGLNFSFKMQFLRVSRRKNRRFFPVEHFFFVLYMIIYQRALIPSKLPCPKKLVTPWSWLLLSLGKNSRELDLQFWQNLVFQSKENIQAQTLENELTKRIYSQK